MDHVVSANATEVTAIVTRNGALDRELLVRAKRITPGTLHQSQGEGRWTLAQQLGHLGEFPPFFAEDLQNWLRHGPGTPVGRTHDHPARLRAVEAAREKSLGELLAALEPGFRALSQVLSQLTARDLTAPMENRKHGSEPLTNYLERYILGHKTKHVGQLQRSFDFVANVPPE